MIAEEHDGDQRHDGEEAGQRGAFSGHGDELGPERAGAPRVESEPSLDAVGEVAALPQLSAEIVDRGARHGAEYSTGSGVVSPVLSMNSDDSGRRKPITKFVSGVLFTLTILLLKLK